jgi:hypothetical protein
MSTIRDMVLMPVDSEKEYVKHVYLIVILWTVMVIGAGIVLALVAL